MEPKKEDEVRLHVKRSKAPRPRPRRPSADAVELSGSIRNVAKELSDSQTLTTHALSSISTTAGEAANHRAREKGYNRRTRRITLCCAAAQLVYTTAGFIWTNWDRIRPASGMSGGQGPTNSTGT